MFITFECSQCHGGIEIDGRDAGAQVTCPHCQAAITVPRTGLGTGTTIGGFKISSKLGEGGMGEVYLARQLSMDRDVALKILPATLSMQKDLSARFLNEVKLLAKLEHPHIVMAYEAGEDAGVLFLAMTYVEGESLEARLKREGPFSERSALAIARKLAGALAYAWNRHQLLHRDIKPSNVMLDPEGEPKLLDFGLAKSLGTDTALTMTSMMMGTPNYMSPEQAQDSAQVDIRADMYSLGALLYNLVTGEVPFAGTSVMEVIKKQITEPLPDPREYNAELSEGCVILMEIMLAKNREERHASWEAVIADIDRVASGKSPTRTLPEPGASTLRRIRDLKQLAEAQERRPRIKVQTGGKAGAKPGNRLPNKAGRKVWAWAGAAAGLLVLTGGVIALVLGLSAKPDQAEGRARASGPADALHSNAVTVSASSDTQAAKLHQAYISALEYVTAHPEDFDGSISRLEGARKDGAGTEYEVKALEQIQRLEAAKRQKVAAAWRDLKQAAEKLADRKQYAEGIARLEQYTGPYAAELAPDRKKLAEEWTEKEQSQKEEQAKQRAAEEEQKQKAEAQAAEKGRQEAAQTRLNAVMAEAARELLQGEYEATAKMLASARGEAALLPVTNEIAALAETAAKITGMNQMILESYNKDKGRVLEIELLNGKVEKLRITGVSGGKVRGQREIGSGFIERAFGVNELSLREKTQRLGADSPATSIMRGLLAQQGGNVTAAEASFKEAGIGLGAALAATTAQQARKADGKTPPGATNPVVSVAQVTPPALAQPAAAVMLSAYETAGKSELKKEPASPAEVVKIPNTPAEKSANAALIEILKLAGVGTDLTKSRDLMQQTAAKSYPEADAAKIQEAVVAFEKTHGETVTAKSQWRLLDFLKQAGPNPRPPFLQATEENVKRAIEDWRVENNGNIGNVKSSVDKYGITIEVLNCPAQTIRALEYLPLSVFKSGGAKGRIRDIAPLADCPLRELYLMGCPVENFSVIRKIKTLQKLDLRFTPIKDLNVVQGLTNLYSLCTVNTPVKDLSPLKGMKLRTLMIGPTVTVKDLAPVFELPLKDLGIIGCPIKSLDFITNFPALVYLGISSTPLKDLSPLRGLQLAGIELRYTLVRDLSPLEGMPLTQLDAAYVPATNLNALAGMPLKTVHLGHPDLVMDLAPLAGKELFLLNLLGRVTAFAPLKEVTFSASPGTGWQLKLDFDWIKVPDAAKLPEYIPALESLAIPPPGKAEAEIVQKFTNLKNVYITLPNSSTVSATLTLDEFKQKFGRKEKEASKSAKPKPK